LRNGRENALARVNSGASAPETSRAASSASGGGGGGGNFDEVLRSLGGGGGPGGLDIASMMQNPAIMNMAQQMMANGGLERLMSNPSINNMVRFNHA
jgi:small glutamine-rich tetratricopeptide repeat-containing protein alpha